MMTDSKIVPFRKGANEGKADTTLADFYAQQADSRNTIKAYAGHWSRFEEWCLNHGVESMPANDDTVRAYIADLANDGKAVSTIDQAVAAIRHAHRGKADPIGGETLRTRKGIRRAVGVAPRRKARPVLDHELMAMLDACPPTVAGVRDRALLAIGWCAALRRSELVGLSIDDVSMSPQGIQVTIRKSKTDQDGAGAIVPIQKASGIGSRAYEALREWLGVFDEDRVKDGPLFRGIDRHGNIKAGALTGQSVKIVIAKAAKAAGIDPAGFSGHSLRAGLATSAAMRGVGERKIMETTRHTNLRTVHGYIRQATIWETGALSMLF
jgi:integrase